MEKTVYYENVVKFIVKLMIVIIFITFGMDSSKAQTRTKVETIELKTSNPDIIVKVIRDGRILETKAFNNSSSKSFELDYTVRITLKSKTKTFTKTLIGFSSNSNFPLKPKEYSYLTKSELLPAADDETKYIDGTQIKAPQDQSLYNSLVSAELVNFSHKLLSDK